jgi:hypothetical protein
MLFDYAITARVNGRDQWQRISGSMSATATAHTLAHGEPYIRSVEQVRLLILPQSKGDYTYLDRPTAEQIKYAAIEITADRYPTAYKVDAKRREVEREIRTRIRCNQLPLPEVAA